MGIGTPHEEATATIVTDSPAALGSRRGGRGYTSSQPLLDLQDIAVFPIQHSRWSSPFIGVAPAPYPWEPKFLPEQWVYTDGADITGYIGFDIVSITSLESTVPSQDLLPFVATKRPTRD